MSRPSGPTALGYAVIVGSLAGCLGDVPPFRGEGSGGAASNAASTVTATTTTTSAAESSAASEGVGAGSSSSGDGGSPAVSSSSASSSSGGDCHLDDVATGCSDAIERLTCAGLGNDETCGASECPDGECTEPSSILLQAPQPGWCVAPTSTTICLRCDGAGPAVALAESEPVAALRVASFGVGMASTVKVVARGSGPFQVEWWGADASARSEQFDLGADFQTYEISFPPSQPYELRLVPNPTAVEGNFPLWMEIDCVYAVDLASGAAP